MGIDYTINEAKYLLSTLAAIMNDKRPLSSFNRVNWSTVFRLANFNKTANILYYAILGSDEKMTEDVKKGFYSAFNEALLGFDRISKAQEALFWKIDSEHIPAVVFRMSNFNELYPMKEMGIPDALELYIPAEYKNKIDEIMLTMDFIPSSIKTGGGATVYSRNPKCEIRVYYSNPFYDGTMKKYYDYVFMQLSFMGDYKSIRGFDLDNYYVFLVSMVCNSYAIKTTKIRQFLDLFVYYKAYEKEFDWDYIQSCLEQIGIKDMAFRVLELCFIWFDGATAENNEDLNIYDNMEHYILSRGEIGFKESCEYFPLVLNMNKMLIQEQEKAEKENYRKFLYPDAEYMQTLYPVLAKNKFGLMIAYILRRLRLMLTGKKGPDPSEAAVEEPLDFYEPQSSYPAHFLDTDEPDVDIVKTAPLMVADDVRVMEDVLPVNTDNLNLEKAAEKLGSFHMEEDLIKGYQKKHES